MKNTLVEVIAMKPHKTSQQPMECCEIYSALLREMEHRELTDTEWSTFIEHEVVCPEGLRSNAQLESELELTDGAFEAGDPSAGLMSLDEINSTTFSIIESVAGRLSERPSYDDAKQATGTPASVAHTELVPAANLKPPRTQLSPLVQLAHEYSPSPECVGMLLLSGHGGVVVILDDSWTQVAWVYATDTCGPKATMSRRGLLLGDILRLQLKHSSECTPAASTWFAPSFADGVLALWFKEWEREGLDLEQRLFSKGSTPSSNALQLFVSDDGRADYHHKLNWLSLGASGRRVAHEYPIVLDSLPRVLSNTRCIFEMKALWAQPTSKEAHATSEIRDFAFPGPADRLSNSFRALVEASPWARPRLTPISLPTITDSIQPKADSLALIHEAAQLSKQEPASYQQTFLDRWTTNIHSLHHPKSSRGLLAELLKSLQEVLQASNVHSPNQQHTACSICDKCHTTRLAQVDHFLPKTTSLQLKKINYHLEPLAHTLLLGGQLFLKSAEEQGYDHWLLAVWGHCMPSFNSLIKHADQQESAVEYLAEPSAPRLIGKTEALPAAQHKSLACQHGKN